MGLFVINLSDVGEGVAEAELVEWHVAVGDTVSEDQLLGVVMTDKAAVEIPSSVLGKVTKLCGEVGDVVAVGAELIHLEVDGSGNAEHLAFQASQTDTASIVVDDAPSVAAVSGAGKSNTGRSDTGRSESAKKVRVKRPSAGSVSQIPLVDLGSPTPSVASVKVLAAPSVRQRARELGVALDTIQGSGPAGRIVHADLGQFTERRAPSSTSGRQANTAIDVVKLVGMRRKIAEKMSLSKARIPHITIVEEIDVQYLEELRQNLNTQHAETRGKLTVLPFVMKAIVEAVAAQPSLNARFDDEAGAVSIYGGVHIGVATQTPNGLVVPVVKHSEVKSLWDSASEVRRLSSACRDGKVEREELGGSTITISSLGPLGAVATTPIINHPEVAIVGINKMMVRPLWDGQQFIPRKMMNLSCSFDHRVVDGWDAAVFVQKLKSLLEQPTMLFLEN